MINEISRPAGPTAPPLYRLLVSLSLLLVFLVVMLSAYLRLADAGLGCGAPADGGPTWPDCFGAIGVSKAERPALSLADGGPLLPPSVARSFHRLSATVLGFCVLGIAMIAMRPRSILGTGRAAPLAVLGLTLFLSVLGYLTPSPLVPAVTVANILGGMAMLALLWWMSQRSLPFAAAARESEQALRRWARLAVAVLALQLVLGAWTSGSFAGPACPRLGGCTEAVTLDAVIQGYAPARVLSVDAGGRVIQDAGMQAVHLGHRAGALVVLLVLGWLGWRARQSGDALRGTGTALLVLLAAQLALGVTNVLTGLPLLAVTAHNTLAALLLLTVINLNHLLTPGRSA